MFIRATRSSGHTCLHLVESYRDEQGCTRHRQITQPGRADRLTQEKIKGLIASLQRLIAMTPEQITLFNQLGASRPSPKGL